VIIHYMKNQDGSVVPAPDLVTWAKWMTPENKRVALDVIEGVKISTVFLGTDHGFGFGDGPPVLWETMVFGGEHDEAQERYTSEVEAIAGHARWVALVKPVRRCAYCGRPSAHGVCAGCGSHRG
jgi:hypothetical protein